jgi:hypothetical protein
MKKTAKIGYFSYDQLAPSFRCSLLGAFFIHKGYTEMILSRIITKTEVKQAYSNVNKNTSCSNSVDNVSIETTHDLQGCITDVIPVKTYKVHHYL